MKHKLTILSLVFFSSLLSAQDYKHEVYKAYINSDMPRWESVLSDLKARQTDNLDYKLLEYIVEYQYGFIGYLIGEDKKDEAAKELESAISNLQMLMDRNDKVGRYWAFKSAFTGLKIGISPYKAPFLGPRCFSYIDEAMALNEADPYVLLELANVKYYAPFFAGGDKSKAIGFYKTAVDFLEKDTATLSNNWYYLMAKTTYGRILLENGNKKEAIRVFDEILIFEPAYDWVARELRPKAIKK